MLRAAMTLLHAAILSVAVSIGAAAGQEYVTLPGAVWAIVPPPGFFATTEPIAMFKHPRGAAILVQDFPKQAVSRSDFDAAPGQEAEARLDELTEVTVNGRRGFLAQFYLVQRRAISIALILEGEHTNSNIIAAIPDSALDQISADDVRVALLTAVETTQTSEERLAALPFVVDDMGPFRVSSQVAGTVLVMTDGPSDHLDDASSQAFASILTFEIPTGQPFDLAADLEGMTERVKQEYPDARILGSRIVKTSSGDLAEVLHERATPAGMPIAGVTWAKAIGSRVIIVMCQHPRDDTQALARLKTLRDSVRLR